MAIRGENSTAADMSSGWEARSTVEMGKGEGGDIVGEGRICRSRLSDNSFPQPLDLIPENYPVTTRSSFHLPANSSSPSSSHEIGMKGSFFFP